MEDSLLLLGPCPCCDSENAPMGILGRRVQYSCRFCGIVYSVDLQDRT